jgi:hypothetical protein
VVHPLDKERGITLDDFKLIKMHMANCMIFSIPVSLFDFNQIFCFCLDDFFWVFSGFSFIYLFFQLYSLITIRQFGFFLFN